MDHKHEGEHKEHEGSFYKGLFWGLIAGVGLLWFLNSDEGKRVVERLKDKLDETLGSATVPEDEEDDLEIGISQNGSADTSGYITSEDDL
jgi:hypothetical protein